MIKVFSLSLAVLALALCSLPLQAATVSLDASSAQVDPGGMFTVNLVLDASDAPGAHPGSYGGAVVIDFDPNLVNTSEPFSASGNATIRNTLPSVPAVDCTDSRVVCFTDATTDVVSIGTFTFTLNPAADPGQTISIGIADADDFFGTFVNDLPTNQAFIPDFIGTSVFAVPVPAVAWFMSSGLAVFGFFIRRRR